MSTKCVSVVVVYNGVDLLKHYLEHYQRIGVDEMLIAAGIKHEHDMLSGSAEGRKQNELSEIIEVCRPYGARIYPFVYDKYRTMEKLRVERNMLAHYGIGADDYVMWTDLDEFFSFPCPLSELIDAMNCRNDWAIHGWILDRVAEDGSFPPLQTNVPIEQQFPIGCHITGRFLQANTRKIMIARGRVRVNAGHDNTENGHWKYVPVGKLEDYVAHHFRWSEQLTTRVMERLQYPDGLSRAYIRECERLCRYYKKHCRINLADPVFRARRAKPIQYFDDALVSAGNGAGHPP